MSGDAKTNGDNSFAKFNPRTPRSTLAVKRCGYVMKELKERPISSFVDTKNRNKGLRNQLAAIKYKHFENRRKAKMSEVIKERTRMIEFEMTVGTNFDADAYEKHIDVAEHSPKASARSPQASPKNQRWLTIRELLAPKVDEMAQFFRDTDVGRKGKLPEEEFRNGLQGLQLGCTPPQIKLIVRRFSKKTPGFVDYKLFLKKLVAKIPFQNSGALATTESVQADNAKASAAKKSEMIAREEKRLELIKARQKRELQSVLEFEKEMAKKFEESAKRAEKERIAIEERNAERKARLQRQAEKKREKQVQKAMELEQERLDAQERARRDFAVRAEERERMARKLRARELARRQKAEEERLKKIERQRLKEKAYREEQEMLAKKIEAMELKNKIRQERMRQANKERKLILLQKREKADLRIARALQKDAAREAAVKRHYAEKQRVAEIKRKEKLVIEAAELKKHQAELVEAAKRRKAKFLEAKRKERAHIQKILNHQAKKQLSLAQMYQKRDEERQRKYIVQKLKLRDKLDTVERIKRLKMYRRQKLGKKLDDDADRVNLMMYQKKDLLAARIQSGQDLWRKKQRLVEDIEKLRAAKKWGELDEMINSMGAGDNNENEN